MDHHQNDRFPFPSEPKRNGLPILCVPSNQNENHLPPDLDRTGDAFRGMARALSKAALAPPRSLAPVEAPNGKQAHFSGGPEAITSLGRWWVLFCVLEVKPNGFHRVRKDFLFSPGGLGGSASVLGPPAEEHLDLGMAMLEPEPCDNLGWLFGFAQPTQLLHSQTGQQDSSENHVGQLRLSGNQGRSDRDRPLWHPRPLFETVSSGKKNEVLCRNFQAMSHMKSPNRNWN